MKVYKRIKREWNEHLRGKFSLLLIFFVFLIFSFGFVFGASFISTIVARTAFKILEQYGFSDQLEHLIKMCMIEQGLG